MTSVFFHNGLCRTCRHGKAFDGKALHNPPEIRHTTPVWLYQG